MTKGKGTRASEIRMIPIDRINILNPRVRNQKVFLEIATNMIQVGMKRPITVTPSRSKGGGKDYDLICGQGRIEAFTACGQTQIPAIVIDASEEQALIMSLVENLARRQHRATDLLQGIEILQKQGYDAPTIAAKTGLSLDYVNGVLNLMERGEERLLSAVEAGHMPISLAIRVAESRPAKVGYGAITVAGMAATPFGACQAGGHKPAGRSFSSGKWAEKIACRLMWWLQAAQSVRCGHTTLFASRTLNYQRYKGLLQK